MKIFDLNYAKKNIPTASVAQYKLMLTSESEKVIKRMRWKVSEFLGKLDSNRNKNETYGFKSLNCPPAAEEMAQFENDLLLLIKKLRHIFLLRTTRMNFQTKTMPFNKPIQIKYR